MAEEEPPFLIGDTVHVLSYGSVGTGVIMAEEVWVEPDKPVAWDGTGERPADKQHPRLVPAPQRFLIRMLAFNDIPGSDEVFRASWRARCLEAPHSFPFVGAPDMRLISRPRVSTFEHLAHFHDEVTAQDFSGLVGEVCVSDSAAECRRWMAEKKALKAIPLQHYETTD